MKVTRTDVGLTSVMTIGVAAILILIPFHGFLTVWLASVFGHYTLLRLWKEALLVLLVGGVIELVRRDPKLRWRFISYKLHWLLLAYVLLQLIWGGLAYAMHNVSAKALGYALIINLRFLAFFVVTWVVALYVPRLQRTWRPWILWPLLVVVGFGLLQYFVLPYDVLRHVGYNQSTIFPYETINHDLNRLRVMSTLRGANPLGAYLVLALSLLTVIYAKSRRIILGILLVAGLLVMYLSFSRSAWIGLVLSLSVIVWLLAESQRAKQGIVAIAVGIVIVAGILTAVLWDNTSFQSAVFHTNDHSTVRLSSNQGHESALQAGIKDVLHQPFGQGPGSAGPASVYNNHPARVAENYFIQVAQESGWLGLLLFAAINVVVGRALWRRRHQTLALGLFASLIGLSAVNMLAHAWADDTLAYLWWGLAGIAIASDFTIKDATEQTTDVDSPVA